MGFKIVRDDGKTDWGLIRRFIYVGLATWVIGVRLIGLNPFDDFSKEIGLSLGTFYDALGLLGVWLIIWHVLWPNRPALG